MKKTIALMAFAALSTLTMFSCKKKDNNNTSSNGSMTATINNTSFSASRCTSAVADTILNITGANYSGTTVEYPIVTLTVYNYHGVGTYTLDQSTFSGVTGTANIDSSSSTTTAIANTLSTYGTINITSTSPNITGTFSFTTEDSTKVTNGSFTATSL